MGGKPFFRLSLSFSESYGRSLDFERDRCLLFGLSERERDLDDLERDLRPLRRSLDLERLCLRRLLLCDGELEGLRSSKLMTSTFRFLCKYCAYKFAIRWQVGGDYKLQIETSRIDLLPTFFLGLVQQIRRQIPQVS